MLSNFAKDGEGLRLESRNSCEDRLRQCYTPSPTTEGVTVREPWEDQGPRQDLEDEGLDDRDGTQVVQHGSDRNVGNDQSVGQQDFGRCCIHEKGYSASKCQCLDSVG